MMIKGVFKSVLCRLMVSVCMAFAPQCMQAANPFLPLWEYIPDGEPYVFEDPDRPGKYRVYVYGSHDILLKAYCGRDQVVWSAPVEDLNSWRYDGVVFESRLDRDGNSLNADGVGDVLFAPDVTVRTDENGKKRYYLYPNNQAGGRNGMIAVADRPDGPFRVTNWSAADARKTDGVLRFDPAVFVDDDGRVYGYWGFRKSYGAELDPKTMATVKPGTEVVEDMVSNLDQDGVFRFFEASSMRKIKDKYVFIYSRMTADGDFGMGVSNYTLAYAYSNSPLGPFTYGGTIIDGRAREKGTDGNVRPTAHPGGNTHGSIVEVNGQWYVVYHRQCGLDEYSRQAMVAPIDVKVTADRVTISEAEYTSEGFETGGLNPFTTYPAGIACYYTGPRRATAKYPVFTFSGSYPQPVRIAYDGKANPYDLAINRSPLVNNTAGSVVGYKYYNMSLAKGKKGLSLCLSLIPGGVDGEIEIRIDAPDGPKVGGISLSKSQPATLTEMAADVPAVSKLKGKHALYLVFKSSTKDKSICEIETLRFKAAR
ncbi:MAG: family 43 glycosylhydrolase [Prevotellaceae bacterium]|nr:family 43 glycosylhydrolase [Prevotellaceae bacterium]MDO4932914.1 family 43 glycosylhydrolase [Prevotellaceae bacterium]